MSEPLADYLRVRELMRTGDCIAFSGKGHFSEIIKWRSRSQVSHVGKVLLTPGAGVQLDERVMLCESTTSKTTPDSRFPEVIKGVQLHYLRQSLLLYEGEAWWYAIKAPLSIDQTDKMVNWLTAQHVKRVPYDLAQALGAGVDFWDRLGFSNTNDFDKLFCSELCAKADVEAGLLPPDFPCSEIMPSEYLAQGAYREGVKIL
jgi:hypothetical protein